MYETISTYLLHLELRVPSMRNVNERLKVRMQCSLLLINVKISC